MDQAPFDSSCVTFRGWSPAAGGTHRVRGLLGTQAGTEPCLHATAGSGPVAFSLEIWAEGLSAPQALTHPEQGLTSPIIIII